MYVVFYHCYVAWKKYGGKSEEEIVTQIDKGRIIMGHELVQ
jgi:hypothetical protein